MLELRENAGIDLARSAARHGVGLFETILVREGLPLHLDWHLERLAGGASFLGMEGPPSSEAILRFINDRFPPSPADCVLRLYAVDDFIALDRSQGPPPPLASAAADLASTLRRSSTSPLCRFKTLSYLENILLAREADARQLADVVARNERGSLSDGGRTSFFAIIKGRILTPPLADGALPGIARRFLLEAGLAREATLEPEDLELCDAAFLANSIRSVIALDRFGSRSLDPSHPLLSRAGALFEER
jgi:branched-chain amino acid aminotransferase